MALPSLYIHIPFCASKCSYCSFYSIKYNKHIFNKYLEKLIQEISFHADEGDKPDTIYIGGGTPTILNTQQLNSLLENIYKICGGARREYTIEANPESLSPEKIEIALNHGVNRFSIGVQSTHDSTLDFLGRIHNFQKVRESVESLKSFGVKNFSLDLIYGIPNTSIEQLNTDLQRMIEMEPTHISCYNLSYEEGSKFYEKLSSNFIKPLAEITEEKMYRLIINVLENNGFNHYEISNFSKPGYESKHNLKYWTAEDYIGCGPGASSYLNNLRWTNASNVYKYIQDWHDELPARVYDKIDKEKRAIELFVMGLRLRNGISFETIESKTGINLKLVLGNHIDKLITQGSVSQKDNKYFITEKYIFLSDSISCEFF